MTEAELRAKHAVTVAWSNVAGPLDNLLAGAFNNMPTYEVLSDFVSVMGLAAVEKKWNDILSSCGKERNVQRTKPYVEKALERIRCELGIGKTAC